MMKFLRSQSQTVLVIVLGVLGLGFVFYGTGNIFTNAGGHVSNDFGRIDGEDLTVADLSEAVRNIRNALIIQNEAQKLSQPGAAAQVAEEAWRQLLLLREADRLHIQVTPDEVVKIIHDTPTFQKDGVYSPEVYLSEMTALSGILRVSSEPGVNAVESTKEMYETIISNNLRINAVRNALFSTVRTSAQDVSAQYEKIYGPASVSLVSFDSKSFVAGARVTPDEIAAEYKAHPENPAYRTKEKRKVDYVLFLLSPDQAKLPDKNKAAAKNALGEKALDFALAFQPDPSANPGTPAPTPDFAAEAKKRGLTPATTDFFTDDTPPANVPPSPAFNSAAFALTEEDAISKVVELENGVAVLHLAEIQPSDLRPLDEVKDDIAKQLQQAKGFQAAQDAAQDAAKALQDAVAKGADFKTAAAGMKLKVETLPVFVPIKAPQTDARMQTIAYAVSFLTPGQVSEPVPIQGENSTVILHLDGRAKADPAGLADFEIRFRDSQDQQLRTFAYVDWANWKSRQPGTHKPPDLDAFGSVE